MKLFETILFILLVASFCESFHKGDGKPHPHPQQHESQRHKNVQYLNKDVEVISDAASSDSGHVPQPNPQSEKLSAVISDDEPKSAKQISTSSTTSKPSTNTTSASPTTVKLPESITTGTTTSVQDSSNSPTSTKSTTPTPTPSTATAFPKPTDQELYCLCDIHRNTCDMNCCCDMDCTDEDRAFFSHCVELVGIYDDRSSPRRQRSCYKSFVTFKHYIAEGGIQSDNGMLCILRDNNKADNILPPSKLTQLKEQIIAGEINIRPKYSMNSRRTMIYRQEPYKYGSPILGMKVADLTKERINELFAYGLPAAFHAAPCTKIREPIKFLENFHSQCRIPLANLSRDCQVSSIFNANSFLGEMQILKNPGDKESELIPIVFGKVCNGDLCSSSEAEQVEQIRVESPIFNGGKLLCQNVLTALNVTIVYGLDGISDVTLNAQLQDLPASTKHLVQEYRAKFVWNTELESNETSSSNVTHIVEDDFPRSGNPGYIIGKPVIFGEKVPASEILKEDSTVTTETPVSEAEIKEIVAVGSDASRWMSIHGPGKCPKNPVSSAERKSVLFDFSHLTLCSLNLTEFKYCEDLQLQVAKILLGTEDATNFDKRKWQVAAFGNSNSAMLNEWVPVTFRNFPITFFPKRNSKFLLTRGCDSIVSSLNITIAYAFVGSVDFPQAKITGVLYELGDSVSITKEQSSKTFNVAATVIFKDVTAPPVMSVAKWPVLSIRLPKDFFYPFSP